MFHRAKNAGHSNAKKVDKESIKTSILDHGARLYQSHGVLPETFFNQSLREYVLTVAHRPSDPNVITDPETVDALGY